MQILAVNPWICDFSAYDLWAKPLGFLYILRFLKNKGFHIDFIDLIDRYHPLLEKIKNYRPRDNPFGCGKFYWEEIPKPSSIRSIPRRFKRYGIPPNLVENYLKRFEPQVILVSSSMTYWYPGLIETVNLLRKVFKNIPIIAGGTYVILCKEHAEKNIDANFLISSYIPGELSGIFKYLFNVEFTIDERSLFKDIPFYEGYHRLSYIALRRSWGCPYDCNFCGLKKMYKGYYQKPPGQVIEEIEYFSTSGIRNFAFYDDALCFNREEFVTLLESMIKKGLKINIHTPNALHASFLDEELANLIKKSGFLMPRISFESSQYEIIKNFSFKVDRDTLLRAVRNLRKAGYQRGEYGVYLMFGAPYQDLKLLEKDIEFVYSLGAKIFLADFAYIPGIESDKSCYIEPLFHNNSLFPELTPSDRERALEIKNKIKQLNQSLSTKNKRHP